MDGEQAQDAGRNGQAETHNVPMEVARHRRKIALTLADMPRKMIERIANSRMEPGHKHLDALMDG